MQVSGKRRRRVDCMENKKFIRALYICIAVVMLIGMIVYSGVQEFWYDEVYQIGLVRPGVSLGEMLRQYTELKDYTPPLYALAAYVWIRLIPFSFRFLLLLPEAMTAAGVFVIALTGEKTGGKRMGLLAELLASTSPVLILSAGYEFRAYALYFLAVSLVLYFLAGRVGSHEDGSSARYNGVFYTLSLILLLYSHYYGSIIIGVLFALELVFIFTRKQKATVIFYYVLSGVVFLPWLILIFLNRKRSITEFWVKPPDLQSVFKLAEFLCSKSEVQIGLFCLGIMGCIACVAVRIIKREFCFRTDAIKIYVPGVLFGVTAAMFLYGAVINPSGGIFYNRYFVGMLPCCFWIMAYGLVWLWDQLPFTGRKKRTLSMVLCVALCVITFVQNGNTFMSDIKKKRTVSYTASVKELSRKPDISDLDTVVLTSDNSCVRAGVELYFEELFHMTGVNVLSQHDDGFEREITKYKKIYLFRGKQPVTEETGEFLSGCEKIEKDKKKRITVYLKG